MDQKADQVEDVRAPKPLRVAFFNSSDRASGAEALICQTVEGLRARGVDARLYVKDQFTDLPYVHRLPFFFGERRVERALRKLSGRNNIFFPSTYTLKRHVWIKTADIWHFHNLHGHFVSIPLLAAESRRRTVVLSPVDQFLATGYCPYTLGCERFREGCGMCPQLDLPYPGISRDTTHELLMMKERAVRRSRFKLLVHTNYLARYYASTFVGSLPIERLYYGVDTEVFRPMERAEAATALGIAPVGGFVVGLIHSNVADKRKGLLPLLDLVRDLGERLPGRITVLVVGTASERAMERATPNMNIVALPFLKTSDELARALNLCDVLLYPTRADNLSLTCLDALACGVPVISSRVGGQVEAVEDGVNGFLTEPGDNDQIIERVAQMATDEELTGRLSEGARSSALERFRIDSYIDNLLGYYNRVLEQGVSV
ncbi:MAG TPA: glycosyltransferase [Pyrinomonadaceae bacterium]